MSPAGITIKNAIGLKLLVRTGEAISGQQFSAEVVIPPRGVEETSKTTRKTALLPNDDAFSDADGLESWLDACPLPIPLSADERQQIREFVANPQK